MVFREISVVNSIAPTKTTGNFVRIYRFDGIEVFQ